MNVNYSGNWNSGTSYNQGDFVVYQNVMYIALGNVLAGQLPPDVNLSWELVVYGAQFGPVTPTPTVTPGLTATPTPTTSEIPVTPTPTITITPTSSEIPVTPTPTSSEIPVTPTSTPESTVTPTVTPTITKTPAVTQTNTPTLSVTPSPTNAISASCVNVLSYKQIGSGFSVNDPGYMQLPSGTPFSSATIEYRFNNTDSNGTNAWNIFGNLLSGDTILVESNDFGYNYISYQVVTPPVWNGLHWFIGQVSVLDTNTNSRAVFTISSNVTFTINSLCPSPTPTETPTVTVTPTSSEIPVTPTQSATPTPTPQPVTGYSFNLVALPYNFPTSGNSIMNGPSGSTSGSTDPNVLATGGRGFYFNSIDSGSVDRTNYYSTFTGQSVTITLTQLGSTAIYSGDTGSFKQWVQSPIGSGFVFGANINVPGPSQPPGNALLLQSAPTPWVIGEPVYVSLQIV